MKRIMIISLKNNCLLMLGIIFISSCSVIPGMQQPRSFEQIDLEGSMLKKNVIDITPAIILDKKDDTKNYKIAKGDTLSIIVFGEPDYFPTLSVTSVNPYTSRLVDEKGIIFFPFVGEVQAEGLTISEIRNIITERLEKYINDPQVDVSIAKYSNNRNIYILGEVTKPKTINLDLVQITLADAISLAEGLSTQTSNPRGVFVIRRQDDQNESAVYRANLNDASKFLIAGDFRLLPGDIVYVGPSDITKWNRFISQLFPFASFVNQIDNIEN